jgi:hypothetical protein
MIKMKYFKMVFLALVSIMLLNACDDQMEKHYEVPGWLKGSAWEVLEARGDYAVFLKGAELAGFKPILEGKSLVTVMAPNDGAFATYLSENGKSSIEDYSQDELRKLIGFHIMYYSYDKDMLVNFRPEEGDGATEEEKMVGAGLFYKHRTRSSDAASNALDTNGVEITVYHNERLLPVFSPKLFQTKGIDARYNYEYFYPNSEWTGGEGFNVSNASVAEYELIADNGYLNLVDKVVDPLETIYTELKERPEYSTFLGLYDQYTSYEYDEQLTTDFGNGTDLYLHNHSPLPNIANEWPIGDYRSISLLSFLSFSVFAPSNSALDAFFESYWQPGGYSSFSEVDEIALAYLLYNSTYGASIVFPEEIKSGDIINDFDMKIDFEVDEVPAANRVMCVNGALYGLNQLDAPGMFKSVTGPAFRYKDGHYYLYMLDYSRLLVGLSSNDATLATLIPKNDQMAEGGISMIDGLLWSDYDGDLSVMNTSSMTEIVNLHTVTGGQGINSSGAQVLRTNIPYTYWYVKDGKLTTSVLFNKKFDNPASDIAFANITEISYEGGGWSNGKAYWYDEAEVFLPLSSTASVQNRLAITRDESYPYFRFSELLRNAGLVDATNGQINFLLGVRCAIFIPTNEIIAQAVAAGQVPGVAADGTVSDQQALASYLKGYFVPTEPNGMITYPYAGAGINGTYDSMETFGQLLIEDDGQSLKVQRFFQGQAQGNKVNVIPDYDYFPFAFDDGGVHYIDGVL